MKSIAYLVFALSLAMPSMGDVTGTNPANGACLCINNNSVNIRSSACGTVIGSANTGSCYKYRGTKTGCTLSGVYYEFFSFDYGGTVGWAAGTYLNLASDSSCAVSDGYTCAINSQGMRIHETTSPTPYDCRDNGCGNSCQGGQCVALVTCRCTKNGNYVPNTSCWRPGTALRFGNFIKRCPEMKIPVEKPPNTARQRADGTCNSAIPVNTAIATFDASGRYYAGHAAIFVGCADSYTIRVYDQWCCRSIGYTNYGSSHSYYSTFAMITNPGICSDRTSWSCRTESAGSTCCPTSVSGCLKSKYWWQPFMKETEP